MSKKRVELSPTDRFEWCGKRIAVLTYQAGAGAVTWDTWVALRTQRAEYVGSVKVSQLALAANKATDLRLWKR